MRPLFAVTFVAMFALPLQAQTKLFHDDFSKGIGRWQFSDAKAWKATEVDKVATLQQFQQSQSKPPHRSPYNMALVKDLHVTDFVFEAKALSTGKDGAHRDMCVFFNYQDPAHFYYVHIAKQADDRANQIFIVDGADRKKISKTSTTGTPWDDKWHDLKVVRKVDTGAIEIYFDGKQIMSAEDKTFLWGQVGVGSFDDTGHWADVRVAGNAKK